MCESVGKCQRLANHYVTWVLGPFVELHNQIKSSSKTRTTLCRNSNLEEARHFNNFFSIENETIVRVFTELRNFRCDQIQDLQTGT